MADLATTLSIEADILSKLGPSSSSSPSESAAPAQPFSRLQEDVVDTLTWLRRGAYQLAKSPPQTFLEALNSPPGCAPARAVRALLVDKVRGLSLQGCWERLDKPATFPACHLVLEGHSASVNAVCWSPDGSAFATGSDDKRVRLWSASAGEGLHTLEGHDGAVFGVAWSPDGLTVASAAYDKTIRLWR